jgi:hypothetical protein
MSKGTGVLYIVFAFIVLTVTGVGVVWVSSVGPSIFNPVQASNSVSAAPENQNSGILSTPTVKVVPTETLVRTVVETPKPLPTETPVRPTETETRDPSPTPTVEISVEDAIVLESLPESSYGHSGEYFKCVGVIKKEDGGFSIKPAFFGPIINIVTIEFDTEWVHFSINGVAMRAKPGTLLEIMAVPEGIDVPDPSTLAGLTLFYYDPLAQKFATYPEGDAGFTEPYSTFKVYVHEEGNIVIGGSAYTVNGLSENYCKSPSYYPYATWKWKEDLVIYSPLLNGCPSVELVQ